MPETLFYIKRECLVLWIAANDLLAEASFDLSKAAKHLFLDARLSLARHTLARSVQKKNKSLAAFDIATRRKPL
jgi:hypothetical protein